MTPVTREQIERIFEVTDALGLSREALVIPLRPGSPGSVRRLANGSYEIVVDAQADFDQWLMGLRSRLLEVASGG